MIAVISLLIVLTLSLLITRIATVALTLTGLSSESASFQARSALTGTGFTTTESESIVNHPLRRRIVMLLMILRNAGLITAASSLILSFVNLQGATQALSRFVFILIGVSILLVLAHSPWVDKQLSRVIQWALKKWTALDVRDYFSLLHFSGDYKVTEIKIRPEDWMAEKMLKELELPDEGVLALGVQRGNGDYIGAPTGKCKIHASDTIILYGKKDILENLDRRRADRRGERAHQRAVESHQEEKKKQSLKEK